MTALEALAVITVGVVAGCYLDGALVLVPAQRRLSAAAYVEVEQANTALGTVRYRLLLTAAVTTQLALLVVDRDPGARLFWLTLTSLLLIVGVTALITVRQVVPLNRAVHDWQPQQPPADWEHLRDQWHHLHYRRTGWIVLALLTQVTAVLAH